MHPSAISDEASAAFLKIDNDYSRMINAIDDMRQDFEKQMIEHTDY